MASPKRMVQHIKRYLENLNARTSKIEEIMGFWFYLQSQDKNFESNWQAFQDNLAIANKTDKPKPMKELPEDISEELEKELKDESPSEGVKENPDKKE